MTSEILNDESTPEIFKQLIRANTVQLHDLYWKHPAWFTAGAPIPPILRLSEVGALFLVKNQLQFGAMRQRLPREIRDLIWAQVWDEETIEENLAHMRNTITSTCKLCRKPESLDCPYHIGVPYFVRPRLVEIDMATELVESWYNIATTKYDDLLCAFRPAGVKEIICKDTFGIGLDPARCLRKLTIEMSVDSFVPPPETIEQGKEGYGSIRSAEHRRELITEPLLRIQNKSGFKLTIKINQRRLQLSLWQEVFDALREPVTVMREEGATVKASFGYGYRYEEDSTVVYDILKAMMQPENEWRAKAVAFFDAQTEIADIHRLYRDEERPDFDPKSNVYLTEEEIEDKMEAEMDAILYGDNKEPPPHHYMLEYMETGTLKHEKGVCHCPDCLPMATHMWDSEDDDVGSGYGDSVDYDGYNNEETDGDASDDDARNDEEETDEGHVGEQ